MKKYEHVLYWTQWSCKRIKDKFFILEEKYHSIAQNWKYDGERNALITWKKDIKNGLDIIFNYEN